MMLIAPSVRVNWNFPNITKKRVPITIIRTRLMPTIRLTIKERLISFSFNNDNKANPGKINKHEKIIELKMVKKIESGRVENWERMAWIPIRVPAIRLVCKSR
jgi:hypothetical protein